jgi:hypothetical protein
MGVLHFSYYPKDANLHYFWQQLSQWSWWILSVSWLLVAFAFPHKVIMQTLLHKHDNLDGCLTSINILEFISVIINYCAVLHMILTSKVMDDPHPVLLNVTNNASVLSWTTGAC